MALSIYQGIKDVDRVNQMGIVVPISKTILKIILNSNACSEEPSIHLFLFPTGLKNKQNILSPAFYDWGCS